VLADAETAKSMMRRAVAFRATEHVQDFLPMSKRDISLFEGCEVAWQRALKQAGVALDDLSFVETHDCFTIAELIEYEAMGLAAPGQGARIAKGLRPQKDGKLPVNPSGGLKAKGHPIGATGVSMHVLTAMQLTGEAGGMQVPGAEARRHLQHGRRGGRANYVSILRRRACRWDLLDRVREAAVQMGIPRSPISTPATTKASAISTSTRSAACAGPPRAASSSR
jgi:acetyl-CoA C-acetyltransferase